MEATIFYLFVLAILIGFAIKYKWPVGEIPKDFKLLFSKWGRHLIVTERHDKHVFMTATILTVTVIGTLILGIWYDVQIASMPYTAFVFLCGFSGFVMNIVREGWMQHKGGNIQGDNIVPFSWRDVRFGTYAGILTGLILGVLIQIFT